MPTPAWLKSTTATLRPVTSATPSGQVPHAPGWWLPATCGHCGDVGRGSGGVGREATYPSPGWLISAACPTLQTALPLRRFAILLDPETTLQQRGALQP